MVEKTNVILMFIDDLGYGDISLLNEDSKIHTPNIDALAERGVVFKDCHATSALCTPSRYGLLTGRYNWRSQLKSGVLPGGADPLIESERETLGTLFQRKGYFTAAVGKWHLGLGWHRKEIDGSEYGIAEEAEQKKKLQGASGFLLDGMNIDFSKPLQISPNDYGFDYFYGTAVSLDQPPYTYLENRNVLKIPNHITGIFPLDRTGATQQQLWQRGPACEGYDFEQVIPDMQKKVLDLIETHAKEPFFIYYPTHAVHGPLLPPKEYQGKSGLNVYADMVEYLDDMVGQITSKLKEKGIWENTMFIFASDNGCSGVADYPYLTSHGHNPSYIFRGKKSDIYEGGHRIPAIISWPGYFKEKQECSSMVCLSDFFATFAEMLGVCVSDNAGEDSVSLFPLLEGKCQEVRNHIVHSSGDGSFSIRNKEWKLELCRNAGSGLRVTEPAPGTSEEIPYQLYDMQDDVRERHNAAADYPDICLQMMEELMKIIEDGRTTPGRRQDNAGMEHWEQLEKVRSIIEARKMN